MMNFKDDGERFAAFCRMYRHPKTGKRFELLPWQRDFIDKVYARKRWMDVVRDGSVEREYLRITREAAIIVARKNGKTTLGAAMLLYHLFADGEPCPEIWCAAKNKTQAYLIVKRAKELLRSHPESLARVRLRSNSPEIQLLDSMGNPTGGTIGTVTSVSDSAHGKEPSAVFIDEVHTLPGSELTSVLEYGMLSRRQPLMVFMTTVGHDEESYCRQIYDKAKAILDGTVKDETFVAALFEAPDGAWDEPKTWREANPSLGYTITEDELALKVEKARGSPQKKADFEWQSLNRWVGGAVSFIDLDRWRELEDDWEPPPGAECWCGLDIGRTDDLTALAMMFKRPEDRGGGWHLKLRVWCAEIKVTGGHRHQDRYVAWYDAGHLRAASNSDAPTAVDFDVVSRDIIGLVGNGGKYRPVRFGIDFNFQGAYYTEKLAKGGIKTIEVKQGESFAKPTVLFENGVAKGEIRHDGSPVMLWSLGCTTVKYTDQNLPRPSKKLSDRAGKIDPVVASIIAMDQAARGGQRSKVWVMC